MFTVTLCLINADIDSSLWLRVCSKSSSNKTWNPTFIYSCLSQNQMAKTFSICPLWQTLGYVLGCSLRIKLPHIESYKSPVEGIFFLWCNLSYPIFLVFTVYILSIWQRNTLCALALGVTDVVTLRWFWCWLASEVSVWEEMVALQGFAAALGLSLWAPAGPHPLLLFMKGSTHGSKHTVWLPKTHWCVWV